MFDLVCGLPSFLENVIIATREIIKSNQYLTYTTKVDDLHDFRHLIPTDLLDCITNEEQRQVWGCLEEKKTNEEDQKQVEKLFLVELIPIIISKDTKGMDRTKLRERYDIDLNKITNMATPRS